MRALAALLLYPTIAAASPAPQDPDEPEAKPIKPDKRAVAEAREANLEPESVREGLAIGVAVGPSVQIGLGTANTAMADSSGTGGGFNLRFGTVASPRWVWLAEIASTVYRNQTLEPGTMMRQDRTNTDTLITFGGQFYVKEAMWIRGGAGLATFTAGETKQKPDTRYYGPGAVGSGGLDLLRRRSFALSVEVMITAARFRDGKMAGGALQLGFSWY